MLDNRHPLNLELPALTNSAYKALKESMAQVGQRVPVVLDKDGRVLDGAHRLRACLELGIEPVTEVYSGTEAGAILIALNARRRHLRADELVRIIDAAEGWIEQGGDVTNAAAAEAAGVSKRTISNKKAELRRERGEASPPGGRPPVGRPAVAPVKVPPAVVPSVVPVVVDDGSSVTGVGIPIEPVKLPAVERLPEAAKPEDRITGIIKRMVDAIDGESGEEEREVVKVALRSSLVELAGLRRRMSKVEEYARETGDEQLLALVEKG